MATWKLRICKNGSQFVWVDTKLTEYNQAEEYCRNLYGNDITIVGHEFIDEDNNNGRKRGWLW